MQLNLREIMRRAGHKPVALASDFQTRRLWFTLGTLEASRYRGVSAGDDQEAFTLKVNLTLYNLLGMDFAPGA